jgi:sarcosine oxidase subunit beta
VRAQFSDPVNIALGLRGLEAFEDFPRRPGQEIDLHQPGYLFLLTDPEQVAVYEQSVALHGKDRICYVEGGQVELLKKLADLNAKS